MARERWMVRGVMATLAIAMCTAALIYVATREPPPKTSSAIGARLELAAGEVLVGVGAARQPAVSGAALPAETVVTTTAGARALVRLPDGSSCFLRGDSELELKPGQTKLGRGEYWLDAPPVEREALVHHVGVVTVAAVDAGLSVRRDGEGAVVYVARGRATVTTPGGRVELDAGQQATAKAEGAPEIAAMAFWEDWTGGMADAAAAAREAGAGAGTIYGVDEGAPPGTPAERLQIKSQTVRAVIREGLSETRVDQVFFNPSPRPVEGWYWFTLPERASVTGFAVETDGQLVEGEFIEKKEASTKYTAAKASGHAPAILEWVDNRTYRARIFPIAGSGTRRVVLRYIELRPIVDGKLAYVYPMGSGVPARIGELSLTADLGDAGPKMELSTLAEARVEDDGRRVTMRRSGYTPRADFQLEARLPDARPALRVARFSAGEGADYLMARYTPDFDWAAAKAPRGDVVVVVDTSAGGDDAARQLRATAAEAVLRALSSEDRFALMSLDVRAEVLHPKEGLAAAEDGAISAALDALADHTSAGATDLAAMFDTALQRVHEAEQPAIIYVGDGIATSGEMLPEELTERLRRALGTSRARLFTVSVGAQADHALLGELARAGGGQSLRIEHAGEATGKALELAAALKVPTVTDFAIDLGAGLDEPFLSVSGKVSRGSEVVLLARTHHDLPAKAKVRGRLGGQLVEREVDVTQDTSVVSAFVPRLWAAEYVRRLLGASGGPDVERGRIASLGIDYGLMTPFTSVLALESESAYRRMGIERKQSRLRGVHLTSLSPRQERDAAAQAVDALLPAVAFGCAKGDEEARASAPEMVDEEDGERSKEGGSGVRKRSGGDEGALSAPAAATAVAAAESEPADQDEEKPSEAPAADAKPDDQGAARPMARVAPGGAPKPTTGESKDEPGPPPPDPTVPPAATPTATAALPTAPPAVGSAAPSADPVPAEPAGEKDRREQGRVAAAQRAARARWTPPPMQTCSDTAARPLAQRVVLWRTRLRTAVDAHELVSRHAAAMKACELRDWRSEQTFLELMQAHVNSPGEASVVLAAFASRPDVQQFIGRLLLRRVVDGAMIAAVEQALFGAAVRWDAVDRQLSEIEGLDERIGKLREHVARSPEDPNGAIRLVRLLARTGQTEEALAVGRRLRDQGFLTLTIARQLGDVLARTGHEAEAVRTYSEIVEFDASSAASRRVLGDIYLGHGWYGDAYRQYHTVTTVNPADPLGWLRLAAAAAGAGRVDEALRLERRVATAQGSPGPDDPRRWARLSSAARLAGLLHAPPASLGKDSLEAMRRELKELQLFRGPGTLVLLTWERLDSRLSLSAKVGEEERALGEPTDASAAGLYATLVSKSEHEGASFRARLHTLPVDDAIELRHTTIAFDGKNLTVDVARAKLPPGQSTVAL